MKKNDFIEIKKLKSDALTKNIQETITSIVEARMKLRRGESKNIKELKNLRITLAKLKTLLTEKQMEPSK